MSSRGDAPDEAAAAAPQLQAGSSSRPAQQVAQQQPGVPGEPHPAGDEAGPSDPSQGSTTGGVQRYADSFMMFVWKVEMCKRVDKHNREQCPYAHPGELARRRHPSLYQALPCPEARAKRICPRLENCNCSHSTFEFWLHPDRYKTFLCERGASCDRPICFFAHGEDDLRELPAGLQRTRSTRRPGHHPGSGSGGGSGSHGWHTLAAAAGGGQGRHTLAAAAGSGGEQLQGGLPGALPGQQQLQGSAAVLVQQQQQQPGMLQQVYAGSAGPQPVFMQQQGAQQLQLPAGPQMDSGQVGLMGTTRWRPLPAGVQAAAGGSSIAGVVAMPPHLPGRGSTVAVIPGGPSAWQSSSLVTAAGEAPSLEALCAAMHRMATPRQEPSGPQQLLFGFQQQQSLQVQMLVPVQASAGQPQPVPTALLPQMAQQLTLQLAPAPGEPQQQQQQQQQQHQEVSVLQAMPAGQQQHPQPVHLVAAAMQQQQQVPTGPDAPRQLAPGQQVLLMVSPDGSQQLGWSSQQQHG